MKLFLPAAVLLAALLVPAGAPAGTAEEIDHLLHHIERSDCVFTRNGKEYTGVEALEHIRMKYDYVKSRVKTAEDFIEYAATKSSLSGKPYLVRCGEQEVPTADWLKEELARFRHPVSGLIVPDPRNPRWLCRYDKNGNHKPFMMVTEGLVGRTAIDLEERDRGPAVSARLILSKELPLLADVFHHQLNEPGRIPLGGSDELFPKHPLLINYKSLRQSGQSIFWTNLSVLVMKDRYGNAELSDKGVRPYRIVIT